MMMIRLERHGALDSESLLVLSQSGELDVYVSDKMVRSNNIEAWEEVEATHKKAVVPSEELTEIKALVKETFWSEWFSYDGHRVQDDIEGYWYRTVLVNGKKYAFYNYPYSDNKLNQLVKKVVQLSSVSMDIDKNGNIILGN